MSYPPPPAQVATCQAKGMDQIAMTFACALRRENISVETQYNGKLPKQINRALKTNWPWFLVVIENETEASIKRPGWDETFSRTTIKNVYEYLLWCFSDYDEEGKNLSWSPDPH